MSISMIGIDHNMAPVDIRAKFAFTKKNAGEAMEKIKNQNGIYGCVILSTCNRVEILAVGKGNIVGREIDAWARARGHSTSELAPYVYVHKDEVAITHLFTVASSLDSMVLGEPQILGQLKEAYRNATQARTTRIINRLLHKSFSVAKRVSTETDIAASAVIH